MDSDDFNDISDGQVVKFVHTFIIMILAFCIPPPYKL